MTKQQAYDVERKIGKYELRRYHPCVVAEVTVSGAFEKAGNAGFRPLINYISGANHGSQKVAMTAPVIQEPVIKIDVSQPALHTQHGNQHMISFVMPAEYRSVDALPTPNDLNVVLRGIPEQLVAVDRFSGRWSEEIYTDRLIALRAHLAIAGFEVIDSARFARFDPPWTPWFMRRNEIQIPVSESN
jgi:hypothetical protein